MSTQPSVVLDQKAIEKVNQNVTQLVGQADDITAIGDNEDYEFSGQVLDRIADMKRAVTNFFASPAKQANDLHKWITSQRAAQLSPLELREANVKALRFNYRTEQEKIRREKEEGERKKAAVEQEKQMLQEAQRLHEIGEKEAAEEVVQQAAMAPPPPVFVPSTIPKERGKSIRKVFDYKIVNPDLVKRDFMIPDEKKIGAIVRNLGPDAARLVGGIEVVETEIESVRSTQGANREQ